MQNYNEDIPLVSKQNQLSQLVNLNNKGMQIYKSPNGAQYSPHVSAHVRIQDVIT